MLDPSQVCFSYSAAPDRSSDCARSVREHLCLLLVLGESLDLIHVEASLAVGVVDHGLSQANAVHEVADTALRDDVGEGVADLDADHSGGGEASLAIGGATEHRQDEDDWVGAPREHGCPACPPDLVTDSLWLGVLGSLEADEEGVHDVGEWSMERNQNTHRCIGSPVISPG